MTISFDFDVDRDGWGARPTEFDVDDPGFLDGVKYVVVHWGGSTAAIPEDGVAVRLRIWQNYHMNRMRDIAYNYAFDDFGNIYRLRGLNDGGHVTCSKDKDPDGVSYCQSSVGIVWVGGAAAGSPTAAGFKALERFIRSAPVPVEVKSHREVKVENGSSTACPGVAIEEWLDAKPWETDLADQVTSNPSFQGSFDTAVRVGFYSKHTNVYDVVTAEKLAVFLDRVGFFDEPSETDEEESA